MPGIDPHGFGLACTLKTQAAIELHGSAIGHQHQLMEVLVPGEQSFHHLTTDALTLKRRMNQQVGKVHDKMTVRDRVAEACKISRHTGGDQTVGVAQCGQQLAGLFRRRPPVCPVEGQDLFLLDAVGKRDCEVYVRLLEPDEWRLSAAEFPGEQAAGEQLVERDAQRKQITVLSSRFYEVQKYLTVTHHVFSPWIVLVSKKWWDRRSHVTVWPFLVVPPGVDLLLNR